MSAALPDFGRPAEFRILEGAHLTGGVDTAPAGYEWVNVPGGAFIRVLMCVRCAGLVLVAEAHDAWHDDLRKPKWRRQT